MQLKFIAILFGGLILSTALAAATLNNNTLQKDSSKDQLELLGKINKHNSVFDNYHTGGIPYEPHK